MRAKIGEAPVCGLTLRQIKEYLNSSNDRWKQWDTEFNGHLSVSSVGVL
jgi:hypothetical protein